MEKKGLIAEGVVKEEGGDLFLETKLPKGDDTFGYYPEALLQDFIGKRIRVTVEIIE